MRPTLSAGGRAERRSRFVYVFLLQLRNVKCKLIVNTIKIMISGLVRYWGCGLAGTGRA